MKAHVIFLLGSVLVVGARAQTVRPEVPFRQIPEANASTSVHPVRPGSKGNTIELVLTYPTTSSLGSDSIMVVALPHKDTPYVDGIVGAIHLLGPINRVIPAPSPGVAAIVKIPFDVDASTTPSEIDTLTFLVVGRAGALVRQSILFTYAFPTDYALDQNYPNPFNPTTTINYQLPYASRVTLTVYDILGCQVKTLVDEMREAGYHQAVFDASGLASGVYIYRLQATGNGTYHQVKRMLLLK